MFLLIGQGAIRRRVSIPGESGYSQKSVRAICAGGTLLADENLSLGSEVCGPASDGRRGQRTINDKLY